MSPLPSHHDDEEALHELARRGIRLPPQPAILSQLERMLRDDDYDARSLAALISQDLSLSGTLFKVARSAFFKGDRPAETLEHVVVRLGVMQVMNLARAVALSTSMSDSNRKAYQMFWLRSRQFALLASLIAEERVSVCNVFPDQAYLAAIFYECGVPVLMQRFPDYCQQLFHNQQFDIPSLYEEDRRFNVDHCNIGYLVARHWKVPEFIAQAILYHEEIPHEGLGAARTVVAILQLAQHAHAHFHQYGNAIWFRMYKEVLAEIGLDQDGLPDYLADLRERYIEQSRL